MAPARAGKAVVTPEVHVKKGPAGPTAKVSAPAVKHITIQAAYPNPKPAGWDDTLPETNMETQKGPHKDYSPSKKRLYGWLSKLWSLFGYPKYLNIGWRTIIGSQNGTIILTTTHMGFHVSLGGCNL